MRADYHMHFEKGSYDENWVEGFFEQAQRLGMDEIGISEHSHTFPEFKDLYYKDLILDDSFIGKFQQQWLKTNKFKYTIDEYFAFMAKLKRKHQVKTGIEVCNFSDQDEVGKILKEYPFDYVIGSVHFLKGWAYDSSEIMARWDTQDLNDVYEWYTQEIEKMAAAGHYDVLGHPYNIRLFHYIPEFDATPYLIRAVAALKKANMVVDINTGTYYRYPIAEITPYYKFMAVASREGLPVIVTSDAHKPEDCGAYHDEAVTYARSYGYKETIRFTGRQREVVPLE